MIALTAAVFPARATLGGEGRLPYTAVYALGVARLTIHHPHHETHAYNAAMRT